MNNGPVAAVSALATLLAGCAGGTGAERSADPPVPGSRTLAVYAAASLAGAFTELEPRFEEVHPDADVVLDFGPSPELAQRIVNGGPADLFAAGDPSAMRTVTDAGQAAGEPTVFATDVLEIVTRPGNPAGVNSVADLARPDLKVVVCVPHTPCGSAAGEVERLAGVTLSPVSEEPDGPSVLREVATSSADAGLVPASDVRAAGAEVQSVAVPEAEQAGTEHAIVVIADAPSADLARAFQGFVTGPGGRAVLGSAGFGGP